MDVGAGSVAVAVDAGGGKSAAPVAVGAVVVAADEGGSRTGPPGALTGALADKHWRGLFFTVMGATMFTFETDAGKVTCN